MLALVLALAPQAQPVIEGPSPEETLALELLNRYRADPQAEAARLAVHSLERAPHPDLDLELFLAELEDVPPVPPLVFDALLMQAGRNHGAYTIANSHWGHEETAERPGFTGQWTRERLAHLDYPHLERLSECAKGMSWGPLEAHWSTIVDDGPGPGGMLEGRGHRKTCSSDHFRLCGVGFAPWPDGQHHAAVHVFNAGDPNLRYVGGVCLLDLDGDGFYDVGEGLGRVAIVGRELSPGHRSTASGAYAISTERNVKIKLAAQLLGITVQGAIPAGGDNAKIDFNFLPAIRSRVEELRSELERPGTQRRAALELGMWRERAPAVVAEDPRIDAEWGRWVAARDRVLAALDDRSALDGAVRDARQDCPRSRLDAFFRSAVSLSEMRRKLAQLESKRPGDARRRSLAKLVVELSSLGLAIEEPRLTVLLEETQQRARELAGGSGPPR